MTKKTEEVFKVQSKDWGRSSKPISVFPKRMKIVTCEHFFPNFQGKHQPHFSNHFNCLFCVIIKAGKFEYWYCENCIQQWIAWAEKRADQRNGWQKYCCDSPIYKLNKIFDFGKAVCYYLNCFKQKYYIHMNDLKVFLMGSFHLIKFLQIFCVIHI